MESDLLVGQLAVNSRISLGTSLNIGLVTSIKIHLKNTTSINLAPGALSSDLSGVHNILKNSILDTGKGARARAESLGLLGTSIALSEDVTLGDDDDMTSREFLLQLTDKTCLNLLEGLLVFEGNIDDDRLASTTTVNFLGGGDVEVTKGCLQFGGGHFEVEKLLSDLGLEFIGLLYVKDQTIRNKYQGEMTDRGKTTYMKGKTTSQSIHNG